MKWVLAAAAVFLLVGGAAAKTHPGDAEALRLLKAALHPSSIPPGSCLSSWDFAAADPCEALSSASQFTCGFRCNSVDAAGLSRVTDVSLDSAGYSGSLSPSIWFLPYLRILEVSDNKLSGSISPPSLTPDLRQLRRISLSGNAFSGEIPVGKFPALAELYLDGNVFSGPVPSAIAELRSLQRVELQMNNLSGGFPDLSRLSDLTYFDASDNAISGNLPPALPPSLVELAVRNNSLQGPFPEGFLTRALSLQVLDLSYNQLSGEVPAALFLLPGLQQVSLSHNEFTSLEAPPWWRHPASPPGGMVAVDLGYNMLKGRLPMGWVRRMPKLAALSMDENMLTGMIPTEYAARVAGARVSGRSRATAEVTPLSRLLLAGNFFYGSIPAPLTTVKEGDAIVSLGDNCLLECPRSFFFCHGREQKLLSTCRDFDPFIP